MSYPRGGGGSRREVLFTTRWHLPQLLGTFCNQLFLTRPRWHFLQPVFSILLGFSTTWVFLTYEKVTGCNKGKGVKVHRRPGCKKCQTVAACAILCFLVRSTKDSPTLQCSTFHNHDACVPRPLLPCYKKSQSHILNLARCNCI